MVLGVALAAVGGTFVVSDDAWQLAIILAGLAFVFTFILLKIRSRI
ncbi:MAG: hypothetical protein IH935_02285 [Acidobacteria bacterium]|nr:hypothetical protein [Acidobacteriota bacterium]MCH8266877.1 hypothetical protein [Acidobacteriota bacterium]